MNLLTAIPAYFEKYAARLAEPPRRALVGVSGGPDSTALLHALCQLKDRLQLDLEVAHLNHLIRGEDAEADARYVAEFCAELGIQCHIASYDVPEFARRGGFTLEEAARLARLSWFSWVMRTRQIPLLLLAHNANDQAETVLFRILRGTGIQGLAGVPALAPLPPAEPWDATWGETAPPLENMLVGRPLLEVWRSEIVEYCEDNGLNPRFDATNQDTDYARNRVRLELLPLLETEYQHGVTANLARLARLAGDEQEWLEEITEANFESAMPDMPPTKGVNLLVAKLQRHPVALQRRLVRLAYSKVAGNLYNLGAKHVDLILEGLNQGSWQMTLPGGVVARVYAEILTLTAGGPEPLVRWYPKAGEETARLELPAEFNLNGRTLRAEYMLPEKLDPKNVEVWEAYLDADKVGPEIIVRGRKPGERFRPLGAPGRKKLQDYMVDRKILPEVRDSWSLVVRPAPNASGTEQIIWVVGWDIADEFKVTPQTRKVLHLFLSSKDEE